MATHTFNKKWTLALLGYLVMIATVFFLAYTGYLRRNYISLHRYDIFLHFIMIGPIAYLLHRALYRRHFTWLGIGWPLAPLLVGVLMTAEELLQSLSPYRTVTLHDMLSNLAGILFFYLLDRWWLRQKSNPKEKSS